MEANAAPRPRTAAAGDPTAGDPTASGARGAPPVRRHVLRRLVAFTVDVGLLLALILLGAVVLSAVLGPAVRIDARVVYDAWIVRVTRLSGIATGCAYFCISWLLFGATPGQWLLGLTLRTTRDDAPLTLRQALVRWIALGSPLWIASSMVSGWVGVAATLGTSAWVVCLLVVTARSATGQGPHDRLSGTRVVRAVRVARVARVVRLARASTPPSRMARDVR